MMSVTADGTNGHVILALVVQKDSVNGLQMNMKLVIAMVEPAGAIVKGEVNPHQLPNLPQHPLQPVLLIYQPNVFLLVKVLH